jgi:hypothetical protein
VPVLIVYGIYRLADAASKSAPLPEGTLTMEKEPQIETEVAGQTLITQCLKDLGLVAE